MLDTEAGGASSGFTYSAQYGVRRASTRPDVYRTQFGSMSADEYLTPMLHTAPRNDTNIARRLSRNSFLIPPQTFKRRNTDGRCISTWRFLLIIIINHSLVVVEILLEYHAYDIIDLIEITYKQSLDVHRHIHQ